MFSALVQGWGGCSTSGSLTQAWSVRVKMTKNDSKVWRCLYKCKKKLNQSNNQSINSYALWKLQMSTNFQASFDHLTYKNYLMTHSLQIHSMHNKKQHITILWEVYSPSRCRQSFTSARLYDRLYSWWSCMRQSRSTGSGTPPFLFIKHLSFINSLSLIHLICNIAICTLHIQ